METKRAVCFWGKCYVSGMGTSCFAPVFECQRSCKSARQAFERDPASALQKGPILLIARQVPRSSTITTKSTPHSHVEPLYRTGCLPPKRPRTVACNPAPRGCFQRATAAERCSAAAHVRLTRHRRLARAPTRLGAIRHIDNEPAVPPKPNGLFWRYWVARGGASCWKTVRKSSSPKSPVCAQAVLLNAGTFATPVAWPHVQRPGFPDLAAKNAAI